MKSEIEATKTAIDHLYNEKRNMDNNIAADIQTRLNLTVSCEAFKLYIKQLGESINVGL